MSSPCTRRRIGTAATAGEYARRAALRRLVRLTRQNPVDRSCEAAHDPAPPAPLTGFGALFLGSMILALAAWLAYSGVVELGFTYDDQDYLDNARMAHADPVRLIRPAIDAPWASRLGVHLYFYALYPWLGQSASGYHGANLVLHWVNGVLLMVLVARHQRNAIVGGIAALLFILSPAPYRAVLWISAVSLVLGLTGVLAALLLIQALLTPDERTPADTGPALLRKRGSGLRLVAWTLAVLLFTAAAFLHQGYAAAALLPVLLAREMGVRDWRLAGVLIAFTASGLLVVAAERWLYAGAYTAHAQYSLWGTHIFSNLAKYAFGLLVGQWLDPQGLQTPLSLVLSVGAAVTVLLVSLLMRPRQRFWAAWIFVTVLPFLFWTRPMVFSRYFYPPAASTAVLLTQGGLAVYTWIARHSRRLAAFAAVFLLCAVTITGIVRLRRSHAVQLYDEGKFLLFEIRDPVRASERLEAALAVDHRIPAKVRIWLAWAYFQQGEGQRAQSILREVLATHPDHRQARRLLESMGAAPP